MTLQSAGGNNPPITMADINGEFGYGNSITSYRGKRWYKEDNSRDIFPTSGPIKFSDFYSKRKTTPVVAGSRRFDYGSPVVMPAMFNIITVSVFGGGGGGGGGCYLVNSGAYGNGGAGSSGQATVFGVGQSFSVSAPFGTGGGGGTIAYTTFPPVGSASGTGSSGANGAASPNNTGVSAGGNGGSGAGSSTYFDNANNIRYDYAGGVGGPGGAGGKAVATILDIEAIGFAAASAWYGATMPCSIGAGGAVGAGGNVPGYGIASAGGQGGNGYITISWS